MADTSRKTIRAVMKCVDLFPGGGHVDWGYRSIQALDSDTCGCEAVLTGTIVRRETGFVFGFPPPVESSISPNARRVHSVIWTVVAVDAQTDGTVQVKLDGTAAVDFILRFEEAARDETVESERDLTLRVPEHKLDMEEIWSNGGRVTGRIVKGRLTPNHKYSRLEGNGDLFPTVDKPECQYDTLTVEVGPRDSRMP